MNPTLVFFCLLCFHFSKLDIHGSLTHFIADIQRANNRSFGSEPKKPDGKRNLYLQLFSFFKKKNLDSSFFNCYCTRLEKMSSPVFMLKI